MTRSIFISGGASGIGLAIARLFAARGWRVGVGDINYDALAAIAGEGLETFPLDVRRNEDWNAALDAFCTDPDGGLDALVNNAGVLSYGWFAAQDPASFDLSLDVNVKGVLLGARAGIDRLRRRSDACLVNIASAAALSATPKQAVYSATKFAVRGLSEALDIEFLRDGVRVACVEPFLVNTPMLDQDDPHGRRYRTVMADLAMLSADEVAEAAWTAVHGDALHYPIGDEPTAAAERLRAEVASRREQWRGILRIKHGKDG